MSGGQKQRVSLAGVLIDESPILLFDEPLANLDPKSGQEMIDLIDHIHHEEKGDDDIIEHLWKMCSIVMWIKSFLVNDGQILFDGHPDELLRTELLIQNGIREATLRNGFKKIWVLM